MSLDPTLKTHGGLLRTRSVLSRAERIERLVEEGKFEMDKSNPMGLPKIKVRHSKAGTKSKKAEETPAEGAEAVAAAPAEATAAEKAPAAKGKAPEKGKVAEKGKAAEKGKKG